MIVTYVGEGCGGRGSVLRAMGSQGGFRLVSDHQASWREMLLRTAKSCGPDAPTLASSLRMLCRPNRARTQRKSASDGGKRARSPGRARRKPLKPLRAGMPDDSGGLVVTNARAYYARGCGCTGHPAFPTPSVFGAKDSCTTRARCAARSRIHVLPSLRGANGSRECAPDDRLRDEAIHSFLAWRDGLLRLRSQ